MPGTACTHALTDTASLAVRLRQMLWARALEEDACPKLAPATVHLPAPDPAATWSMATGLKALSMALPPALHSSCRVLLEKHGKDKR